ncbi:hydrogenase maturation nickel metallochaperone HypA [Streptomyces sp. NPDC006879]|uniref:hydrogenase maturation nickel metallochaperone HypA/HybF n=1 Tax=Streptomyces sp. NPDC006879 TaxID=3364767 RepID=UPI00367C9726
MHELSIAVAAVTQIAEAVQGRSGVRVRTVRLRVGELAGVVPDALRFAFGIAIEDTPLAGAALEIETVPGRARCPQCDREVATGMPPVLWCRTCGHPVELLAGRELDIAQVDLDEDDGADDHAVTRA